MRNRAYERHESNPTLGISHVSIVEFVPPCSRSASLGSLFFATILSAALHQEGDDTLFRANSGCLLAELGVWTRCQPPKLGDDGVTLLGSHQ